MGGYTIAPLGGDTTSSATPPDPTKPKYSIAPASTAAPATQATSSTAPPRIAHPKPASQTTKLPSATSRFGGGMKSEAASQLVAPVKDVYHGLTDEPRDDFEKTVSLLGGAPVVPVLRLVRAGWQDTKDSYNYATKEVPKLAADYLKQGKNTEAAAIIASLTFGPMAKAVGPRSTEVISGVRPGGDLATPLGKAVTDGLIAALSEKTPELAGEAIEGVKSVPAALDKPKLVAAANEVGEEGMKTHMGAGLQKVSEAIKAKRADIGNTVQNIASADRTATANGVAAQGFNINTLAKDLRVNISKINASKTPLSGTQAFVKGWNKYIKARGKLTWEDVKDLRGNLDSIMQSTEGKDRAVLGATRDKLTNMLDSRAKQIGKDAENASYNEATRKLTEHGEGIVKKLANSNTWTSYYDTLAKSSNRPQLNDLYHLINLAPEGIDDFVDKYEPLARLSKSADGNTNVLAGRLQALAKHPLVVGATGATTMMSPLPAKYILSLITMGKAGEFMDRIDAATALRNIGKGAGQAVKIATAPPPPGSTSSGATPTPTPKAGGPGAVGGRAARGMEAASAVGQNIPFQKEQFDAAILRARDIIRDPSASAEEKEIAASQLKSYREQAASLGNPRGTAAIGVLDNVPKQAVNEGGGTRIIAGSQFFPMSVEDAAKHFNVQGKNVAEQIGLNTPEAVQAYQDKIINDFVEEPAKAQVRKLVAEGKRPLESNVYGQGPKGIWYEDPAKPTERKFVPLEKGTEIAAKAAKGGTEGGKVQGQEKGQKEKGQERQDVRQEQVAVTPAKATKPKAYEQFGVSLSPKEWTTPEDVVLAKADAVRALESTVRQRGLAIREAVANGTMDAAASTKAVNKLLSEAKKARLSIERTKSPAVGRAARDRLRKGGEAYAGLGEVARQQANAEVAGDVSADIEAGLDIEKYEKLFAQAGHKELFDKLSEAHFAKHDGEYNLLAKQLAAAYNVIVKAKQ